MNTNLQTWNYESSEIRTIQNFNSRTFVRVRQKLDKGTGG